MQKLMSGSFWLTLLSLAIAWMSLIDSSMARSMTSTSSFLTLFPAVFLFFGTLGSPPGELSLLLVVLVVVSPVPSDSLVGTPLVLHGDALHLSNSFLRLIAKSSDLTKRRKGHTARSHRSPCGIL